MESNGFNDYVKISSLRVSKQKCIHFLRSDETIFKKLTDNKTIKQRLL